MWAGYLLFLLQRPALVFHPQVQPGSLDREDVVAIFLGKRRTWPDGTLIRPFELDSRFPEKRWFLQQVLGWSPKQHRHYWLQELMKGESRPTVVSSRSLLLELVQHLLEHPETLQRERRTITVLFVDIQGFTAFADTHPLDEVVRVLQTALTGFSRAVSREGGMVDKFLGDGLLALFNAPVPAEDHPRRAVRAALHILSDPVLQALPFPFGIGIHTGEALVGRLGSVEKEEYTAIGHTVNLASRLEHATRELGLPLLVSDPVYRRTRDLLPGARRVELRVRGVRTPVVVWGFSP